jgi:hypothetical protein
MLAVIEWNNLIVEPDTPLDEGLAATYRWIHEQYHNRKKGRRVVE